jgi:hypothetical protein
VLFLHLLFKALKNETDIEKHFERGAEVDPGLVFQDDDDKEGGAFPLELDALDGVGVAVFLEKGQVAFVHILDVPGFDIFKNVQRDEAAQELGEKFVVVKDGFEAVVFGFFDSHRDLPPTIPMALFIKNAFI